MKMIEKNGTGILLAILLIGCSAYPMLAPPSPAHCRANGVDVANNAAPGGEIVSFRYGSTPEVLRHCHGLSESGCAVHLGGGRYSIMVHVDAPYRVQTEEACHAIYREPEHIGSAL